MPSLQVFQYAVLTDAAGERHAVGSMSDPANLGVDFSGLVERRVFSVVATGIKLLFDADDSPVVQFSFLWIRADKDGCQLELRTDAAGNFGTENYTVTLRKDLAFVLGSDDSYADYADSPGFTGGTLDAISEIRVRNNGSETTTVEVITAR